MKQLFSRVKSTGILFGAVATIVTGLAGKAAALDTTFAPQASVVLTCLNETKSDKKITKFTNNAPKGSKVMLVEYVPKTGIVSTQNLAVGDVIQNTPVLNWYVLGEQLGPWEVSTSIEGKCLTNESAYANVPSVATEAPSAVSKKFNFVPYVIGSAAVLALLGAFFAGRKFGK